jgi:hypothetical protein
MSPYHTPNSKRALGGAKKLYLPTDRVKTGWDEVPVRGIGSGRKGLQSIQEDVDGPDDFDGGDLQG